MGVRFFQNGIATGKIALWLTAYAGGLLLSLVAHAKPTTALPPARSQFERAEQLRLTLKTQPETERTRHDYERVLDAYRAVYHGNPAASKADASINAVAGLLAEEGRLFKLPKAFHDAVGEYEFLRHQYPGSRYRFAALIEEARIYQQDLADSDQAKAKYREFLKTYPRHPLAAQARAGLKDLREQSGLRPSPDSAAALGRDVAPSRQQEGPGGNGVPLEPALNRVASENANNPGNHSLKNLANSDSTGAPVGPRQSNNERVHVAPSRQQEVPPGRVVVPLEPALNQAASENTNNPGNHSLKNLANSDSTGVPVGPPQTNERVHYEPEELPAPAVLPAAAPSDPAASNRGHAARVTDIRYWSNASYTRIAIDLEDQVRFQAAHVPNPDRIYFDLHDARLIKRLNGRAVDVTDAGFLKRIRSAQYSGDITRIVLDVSSRADYSAFFLPNPWRLIIDIHEHKTGPPATEIAKSVTQTASPLPRAPASHPENELEALALSPAALPPPIAPRVRQALIKPSLTKPSPFVLASGDRQPAAPLPPAASEVNLKSTSQTVAASNPPQPAASQNANQSTEKSPAHGNIRHGNSSSPAPPAGAAVKGTPETIDSDADGPPAAEPMTEDGDRSLVRTLGLKIGRIVIDAGHGGHDSGTLGPGGLQEKDITLDVALRLGKLLKQRLGADVIYTRADDTFVPLQMRTAIANRAHADLFISIHANSSSDPTARGVESYYLNFTTSPDALEVAARENAVSDGSIHELTDLVKQITLKDKIEESREFATDVQHSLYNGLEEGNPGLKDRGVKKAPFVVLIGANMPSILAEISFLTNPSDAHELRQSAYRQRIAESLFRGVSKYVNGLSGVRLAENRERSQPN